jgi:hypothetical protein
VQETFVATAEALTEQHPSSVAPEQFSSTALPHTSDAAGLIAALPSLQSVLLLTKPAGCVQATVLDAALP